MEKRNDMDDIKKVIVIGMALMLLILSIVSGDIFSNNSYFN